MKNTIKVGVIGCGNISDAYLKAAPQFPVLSIVACADINMDAASAKAETYGIQSLTVDDMLADPEIELILNLTTPQHHVPVGLKILEAGKHAYSEKPLALNVAEATELASLAKRKNLRVGCAPDTFLGGSHQTARKAVDAGTIGAALAGSCYMMCPGHEAWHPNPGFYYQTGGGPLMDMGPYYITALINMIGSIEAVTGVAKASYAKREIASGPRQGEVFNVDVETHISAILSFTCGAQVTLTTSFDVQKHDHNHIELYGSKGSMIVSDPNHFEGDIQVSKGKGDWETLPQSHLYGDGNYRVIGLADMAQAILDGRPHRASLELSLHVLETMEAILKSAETGRRISLKHQCSRPAALSDQLPFGHL
ncbi:Gfo/Idh/MocA family protein [Falsihalocynthiibacter arcticus]|uniref:Oxidoreductase n=1 Tax=Falsihalocynthiibacter arcticus TaxID=1579316 RepID=A0A126UZA6_9RHOB|nr:Gfo/Idh/MocA family oxidoreductase [Falsihalocynthiibacter arcticus]AML51393.1 oxidoreductase [Falsihalocynthiibacter arcticus]